MVRFGSGIGDRGSGRRAVRSSSGFESAGSPSLALKDVLVLYILQIPASGCRRQASHLYRWEALQVRLRTR